MNKNTYKTRVLAEGSVLIALTVILKDIVPPIYRLPQGGSITAASMVPLILFALRRGLRWGVGEGVVYGLVHMYFDSSKPYNIVNPVQALLDYPIAFAALGIAGLFKKYPIVGVGVGIIGRFLAHFISGMIFFAIYAPSGMNPAIYVALYNGSYLSVELIISAVIIYILVKRRLLEIYL
ncbi:MAG: energy-coupled thiamine transporter ThiT [Candidatus Bathyarchaeota archaeon]